MKLRFYLRGLGIGIIFSAMICSFGTSNAKEAMSDEDVIARAKELGMVEGTVLSQQGEIDADYTAMLNEADELQTESLVVQSEEPKDALVEAKESEEETIVETDESKATQDTLTKESEETKESQEDSKKKPEETKESMGTEESKESEVTKEQPGKNMEASNDKTTEIKDGKEPEASELGSKTQDTVTITVSGGSGSYTVALNCQAALLVTDAKEFDTYMCINGYSNRICVGTFEIPMGSDYETICKILTRTR